MFRSSSLEGSHLRAHFSLCLRASFSTVLSRPPSLATNRRVTRASSISRFSLVLPCPVPASCPHTRPTVHLAERYTAARFRPICALTECCLSRLIVSPHSHGCVTSGSLPRSRVSTISFPLLLIELTRGHYVLASVSLKTLRAPAFSAIVGKMEIRRDDVGKTQSCLGGNDLEKWTWIGQVEYIYMERGLEMNVMGNNVTGAKGRLTCMIRVFDHRGVHIVQDAPICVIRQKWGSLHDTQAFCTCCEDAGETTYHLRRKCVRLYVDDHTKIREAGKSEGRGKREGGASDNGFGGSAQTGCCSRRRELA